MKLSAILIVLLLTIDGLAEYTLDAKCFDFGVADCIDPVRGITGPLPFDCTLIPPFVDLSHVLNTAKGCVQAYNAGANFSVIHTKVSRDPGSVKEGDSSGVTYSLSLWNMSPVTIRNLCMTLECYHSLEVDKSVFHIESVSPFKTIDLGIVTFRPTVELTGTTFIPVRTLYRTHEVLNGSTILIKYDAGPASDTRGAANLFDMKAWLNLSAWVDSADNKKDFIDAGAVSMQKNGIRNFGTLSHAMDYSVLDFVVYSGSGIGVDAAIGWLSVPEDVILLVYNLDGQLCYGPICSENPSWNRRLQAMYLPMFSPDGFVFEFISRNKAQLDLVELEFSRILVVMKSRGA